ncbi:sulfotransferase family protein [Tsuneonella sp. HG249]
MNQSRFPNLFLAGAPKCGTTSLADWLRQHPDIFAPAVKEPVFFASDLTSTSPRMTESDYRSLYRSRGSQAWAIDGSTHNFYSAVAAERISRECSGAQILFTLRNPVDAVYSMYHQLRFNGTEDLTTFSASLEAEGRRALDLRPIRRGYPENLLYGRVYDFQGNIERYLRYFSPDRVSVVLLDDLRERPRETLRKLFNWLSVDPVPADSIDITLSNPAKQFRSRMVNDLAHYPPRWAGFLSKPLLSKDMRQGLRRLLGTLNTVPRPNPPMDPAIRRQLQDRFAPQVAWLSAFLGRDLSHWLKTST